MGIEQSWRIEFDAILSKDIKQDTWGMRLLTFLHRNDCYILLGEPLSEFTVPSDSAEWIWKSLSD